MKKLIVSSLIATSLLYATNNSFELNLNDNTVETKLDVYLNDKYVLNEESNYYFNLRYLYSEEDEDKNSNNQQKLAGIGFKVMSPYVNDSGFKLGIGLNGVWADNNEDLSFFALPIYLYATYELNEKFDFGLDIGYSPSILTFADGDKYKEANIKASYKILDNGKIFVGYRKIRTEYELDKKNNLKIDFDDTPYFGFSVIF